MHVYCGTDPYVHVHIQSVVHVPIAVHVVYLSDLNLVTFCLCGVIFVKTVI